MTIVFLSYIGLNTEKLEDNHELIQEGDNLISNYIKTEYSKSHPENVVNVLHEYLTSDSMLAHIGKHIGLKDLILTTVSMIFFI